jgi:hypothetical protein
VLGHLDYEGLAEGYGKPTGRKLLSSPFERIVDQKGRYFIVDKLPDMAMRTVLSFKHSEKSNKSLQWTA